MEKKARRLERREAIENGEYHYKYMIEYNIITEKLPLVDRGELFQLLVKLMRICKRLQISMPPEYIPYYTQRENELIAERRSLEKRIIISQINNVNYADLEERIIIINRKLGLPA